LRASDGRHALHRNDECQQHHSKEPEERLRHQRAL
jgi:hypothetical protein